MGCLAAPGLQQASERCQGSIVKWILVFKIKRVFLMAAAIIVAAAAMYKFHCSNILSITVKLVTNCRDPDVNLKVTRRKSSRCWTITRIKEFDFYAFD